MRKFVFVALLLAAGCTQPTVIVPVEPEEQAKVIRVTETELLAAFIAAVESGDFNDTDEFALCAADVMQRHKVNIEKISSLKVGDCRPLKTKAERNEFTAKLKQ